MSDTQHTLYRKYRPQSFDEVIGQDHITSVLSGAIAQKKFSHAYIFEGSRGIGKTSVARIFAREIGCHESDIHEIDAASNRRIDDVRELREAVRALPFESPYKVYIIDEVHMMVKEAFNALLKTLEEPPAHAVFILATTEPEKIPETIMSRCQTFHFKRPTAAILRDMCQEIAKKEKKTIDEDAASLVALLGDGSFRDTHGVFQKVLYSVSGKKISRDDVEKVTGAPALSRIHDVVDGICGGESDSALTAVADAVQHNMDMKLFLRLVMSRMRYILLLRYAPHLADRIGEEVGDDEYDWLSAHAQNTASACTSAMLTRLLDGYMSMHHSSVPTLPLELAIIDCVDMGAPEKN